MAPPSVGLEQDARRTLLGRTRECEAIDRLLSLARDSQGEAIVVHGEPGIGKTALLEYATAGAQGLQVLRAAGNEAEMALPFAALQQFCSPCLTSLEQLPEPQRDALQGRRRLTRLPAESRRLLLIAAAEPTGDPGSPRASALVYGEWLRRERRNVDAREQLRVAHGFFTEFGMEGFAERARIELRATGEHARKRAAETRSDLTPQEAEISRLVAQGKTTSKSPRSSSSARAPSNTTCARSSGSSM